MTVRFSDVAEVSSLSGAPLTGKKVFWLLMFAFSVILAVNITLVYFAVGTFPGLVVKNSYTAGVGFNERNQVYKAQEARHWVADFQVLQGNFHLVLIDSAGQLVRLQKVSGRAEHPSDSLHDRLLLFDADEKGRWIAKTAIPDGLWMIHLDGIDWQGRVFQSLYRIELRQGRSVSGSPSWKKLR